MLPEIDAVFARAGGVATRQRLLTVVTRGQLDHEIRTGQLVAPFPRALCRPWDVDLPEVRRRAALTSVGPPATLSHCSALELWGLPAPVDVRAEHVTVPTKRTPRSRDDLRIHRTRRFPDVVRAHGLITTPIAAAIADSWPLLLATERRGPAITAVRSRWVTTRQIVAAVELRPRLNGRQELRALLDLLAAGCESELEIWGHTVVFDVPGLRHGVRQRDVRVAGRRYRLDLAFEAERVAVELDGATHAGPDGRERDTRRDAALAAAGWLTVRFTHRRLTTDPDGCRRELLAVLATRVT